jgi:hypothetical protein
MLRPGLALAFAVATATATAAAAVAATPASAFQRAFACTPQYVHKVGYDYYGQQKMITYYRDATCTWTIVSYAPVPHNRAATRR